MRRPNSYGYSLEISAGAREEQCHRDGPYGRDIEAIWSGNVATVLCADGNCKKQPIGAPELEAQVARGGKRRA
jgi:hypothetical protein